MGKVNHSYINNRVIGCLVNVHKSSANGKEFGLYEFKKYIWNEHRNSTAAARYTSFAIEKGYITRIQNNVYELTDSFIEEYMKSSKKTGD